MKVGNIELFRVPEVLGSLGKFSIAIYQDLMGLDAIADSMIWADVVYVPRFWYSAIPGLKRAGKPVVVHAHDYFPVCPLATAFDANAGSSCDHLNRSCTVPNIISHERNAHRKAASVVASTIFNSTLGRHIAGHVASADAIVCVSRAQAQLISRMDPALSTKLHVLYNPLPRLRSRPIKTSDFGYFGGESWLKGWNVLKSTVTRFKSDSRSRIHATGLTMSKREGFYHPRIVEYPRLPQDAFEDLYRQIRTVLFPSIWEEPSPYTIVEAMTSGRLVISTDVGGVREISNGAKGIFWIRRGSSEELATAIDTVERLTLDTVTDLGEHNREASIRFFDDAKSAKEFIALLERLAL